MKCKNITVNKEIESIEYIVVEDVIDINVSGNRLFYANGILTHNSAVEEIEFDHSHISGGLSKVMTADNVIGIFTSRAMKERGRYQIQFMKTRNSSGVGQKVDLEFNVDTLRISDLDEDDSNTSSFNQNSGKLQNSSGSSMMSGFKRTSTVITNTDTELAPPPASTKWERATPIEGFDLAKPQSKTKAVSDIRSMIANLHSEKD